MKSIRFASALAVAVAVTGCGPGQSGTAPAASPATAAGKGKPAAAPRVAGIVSAPEGVKRQGVVYLEDAPRRPGAAMAAEIDVHTKEFTPFIGVVTAGGTVTFGNKDALTHHMFSPDLPGWDTGYLSKDASVSRRFETPGAFALLCNIHPEMLGYLLVIPSTSFGVVAPDGKYAIADVPPGTYRATLWAPRMLPSTQTVVVTADGVATANFELRPARP